MTRSRTPALAAVVVVGALLAAAAPATAAPTTAAETTTTRTTTTRTTTTVQTQRLPGLPGSTGSTEAYAVNASGTVAGAATTAGGDWHAVMWVDRTLVDLDRGRTVHDDAAYGVNASGAVVGAQDVRTGRYHARAVLWQGGRRVVLPVPEPPSGDPLYGCLALDVDDDGLIGGYCEVDVNGSVNGFPVVWRGGVPEVPWAWGHVAAVGAAGHLAGRYEPGFDADPLQAVEQTGQPAGSYVVLPSLVPGDDPQDQALDLNAADVAVGQSAGRPVRWTGSGVVALPTSSGGGAAYGINRWGTVAGVDGSRPVAWRQGQRVALSPGAGTAQDVDDRGDVVGWRTDAGGVTTATRWHLSQGAG